MIETIYFDVDLKIIKTDNAEIDFNIKDYYKPTFYDTEEFHSYHKKFVDKVYRIVFEKEKKHLGYCYIGLNKNTAKAPYSAPFAMIYVSKKYRIFDVCELIKALIICISLLDCNRIEFTLPPEIYAQELLNTEFAAFFSNGFKVKEIGINNYVSLEKFKNRDDYLNNLGKMAIRNNKRALKNNLKFAEITLQDFRDAYDIIKINHEALGYPVRISEMQMEDLINMNVLTCRCFGIKKEDIFMAAAIIFDITDEISQVIYWGDCPEYREMKPMTLLAIEIIDYYKNLGKKYLDFGPSSVAGIITSGLADFKKNVGCDNNIKISFEYEV